MLQGAGGGLRQGQRAGGGKNPQPKINVTTSVAGRTAQKPGPACWRREKPTTQDQRYDISCWSHCSETWASVLEEGKVHNPRSTLRHQLLVALLRNLGQRAGGGKSPQPKINVTTSVAGRTAQKPGPACWRREKSTTQDQRYDISCRSHCSLKPGPACWRREKPTTQDQRYDISCWSHCSETWASVLEEGKVHNPRSTLRHQLPVTLLS